MTYTSPTNFEDFLKSLENIKNCFHYDELIMDDESTTAYRECAVVESQFHANNDIVWQYFIDLRDDPENLYEELIALYSKGEM